VRCYSLDRHQKITENAHELSKYVVLNIFRLIKETFGAEHICFVVISRAIFGLLKNVIFWFYLQP